MRKIYLFLSLLIITAGCEKEELLPPADEALANEETLREIEFRDLPAKITNIFDEGHYIRHTSGKSQQLFGPINTNSKIQRINYYKDLSSYTFSLVTELNRSSGHYYFDNLVLKEQADGSIQQTIIRYEYGCALHYSHCGSAQKIG